MRREWIKILNDTEALLTIPQRTVYDYCTESVVVLPEKTIKLWHDYCIHILIQHLDASGWFSKEALDAA